MRLTTTRWALGALSALALLGGLVPFSADAQRTPGVVINEIELDPEGPDSDLHVMEWVELFNPTDAPVDIGGWTLNTVSGYEVATLTVPAGTLLEAGAYYVVERGEQWLDNKEEQVVLRDADDNVVDQSPGLEDEDDDLFGLDDKQDDDRTWQRVPDGRDTDRRSNWRLRFETKGRDNEDVNET